MDARKRKRLEAAGWVVGSTQDFLGLSDEEMAIINIRNSLSLAFQALRKRNKLTQAALATRIGSSQSRVAKMEVGDPSVSLDLLIRGMLALGATPRDVGRVIARREA
jgi:DNA-binding XRE family transcriptional regulator